MLGFWGGGLCCFGFLVVCGVFFWCLFVLLKILGTSHCVSDSFQEGNFLVLRSDALEVIVGVEGPFPRHLVKIASGICRMSWLPNLKVEQKSFLANLGACFKLNKLNKKPHSIVM